MSSSSSHQGPPERSDSLDKWVLNKQMRNVSSSGSAAPAVVERKMSSSTKALNEFLNKENLDSDADESMFASDAVDDTDTTHDDRSLEKFLSAEVAMSSVKIDRSSPVAVAGEGWTVEEPLSVNSRRSFAKVNAEEEVGWYEKMNQTGMKDLAIFVGSTKALGTFILTAVTERSRQGRKEVVAHIKAQKMKDDVLRIDFDVLKTQHKKGNHLNVLVSCSFSFLIIVMF